MVETQPPDIKLYGLLAEFAEAEELLSAVRAARSEGYSKLEAFSPLPVEGLAEELGMTGTRLPWLVLGGAVGGALLGYGLQYWVSVYAYPLNIGGRPLHSWPAFVPVTFEVGVLIASVVGVLALLALNGLPRPHHPLFNTDRFDFASQDRFFLCISAGDDRFSLESARGFLEKLKPLHIEEVPE